MQKQSGSKSKKKPKAKVVRASHRSSDRSNERSTTHYHTRDELDRIETAVLEKHGGREDSTGYASLQGDGSFVVGDDMAEQLTEEFLISAVSGEETHELLADDTDEEALGATIETSGANIFGDSEDEMNSEDTLRESLPTAGNWNTAPKGRVS